MDFIKETDEVYRSQGPITRVTAADIASLKARASLNARRRARLCVHRDSEDSLHEMLIVHAQAAFVPPHRHVGKSESFHIIEGLLSVFIFNDSGEIGEIIPMGDLQSGRVLFYRMSSSIYHSVLPESEFVVFHEVTNGPFNRKDMVIAPWSPGEDDTVAQERFVKFLSKNTQGGENDWSRE